MTAKRSQPTADLPASAVPWTEASFDDAPDDDRPMTEEERQRIAEAREEFARTGVTFSQEHVTALIERMRRQQEGG